MDFPSGGAVKNPPASEGDIGDAGLIPGWGRSPGVGNGNSLQYSCLENSMYGGAWQATVHGVTKSQTQLSTKLVMVAVAREGGWVCGAVLCMVFVPQMRGGGRERRSCVLTVIQFLWTGLFVSSGYYE